MAKPTLSPVSTTSTQVLPSAGTPGDVSGGLVFGLSLYTGDANFLSGAADQVGFVYKKLGGDVVDVELTANTVYASYEESLLEYSYMINVHQARNSLGDLLGNTTGTFNHDGQRTDGDSEVSLKYPKFRLEYTKRVAQGIAEKADVGGYTQEYSASISIIDDQQDYDLQDIIYSASIDTDNVGLHYYNKVGSKRIRVKRVFYVAPRSMWRFFGYYGGLNVIGNLNTYGQYSDDSTFEVIPVWQNKLQAMNFEDSLRTRISHYSYEIINNKLRLFPKPDSVLSPSKVWITFTIPTNAYEEETTTNKAHDTGVDGVNNMNTLPYANIPYKNINSMGKQWIRRYSLALCKEVLGQVRGKFGGSIPIPGESVNLNSADLLGQAKEEQDKLREELKTMLDELTYDKLIERDAAKVQHATDLFKNVPVPIFMG